MITQHSKEVPTPIISCTYYDMYRYFTQEALKDPHDEWPSFSAFFEYLVEQAEEELEED